MSAADSSSPRKYGPAGDCFTYRSLISTRNCAGRSTFQKINKTESSDQTNILVEKERGQVWMGTTNRDQHAQHTHAHLLSGLRLRSILSGVLVHERPIPARIAITVTARNTQQQMPLDTHWQIQTLPVFQRTSSALLSVYTVKTHNEHGTYKAERPPSNILMTNRTAARWRGEDGSSERPEEGNL